MKAVRLALAAIILTSLNASGYEFGDNFADATLRVDFKITKSNGDFSIDIDSVAQWPGWYGRRVNLNKLQYPEILQVAVVDAGSSDTIYLAAKSSDAFLQQTSETIHSSVFVPKPLRPCEINVSYRFSRSGSLQPKEAKIKLCSNCLATLNKNVRHIEPQAHRTLRNAANPERSINIAIVAEGYTADEADRFYASAAQLDSALFTQEAFRDNASLFNVVAVMIPSQESGITVPTQGISVNTILGSHFDSYNMERLLTVADMSALYDAIEGIPAQHIIVLANTEKYGGSGGYNDYAIASAYNPHFLGIITHELGHSFASLADEYESGYDIQYMPDHEPMEPNITTLHDFSGKWQTLIDSGKAGLIEGGGYQAKGVWRGCEKCLMRSLTDRDFCAVCNDAIARTIRYLTDEEE